MKLPRVEWRWTRVPPHRRDREERKRNFEKSILVVFNRGWIITANSSLYLSFRVCLSVSSFFFVFYGIVKGSKNCKNVSNVKFWNHVLLMEHGCMFSSIIVDVDHVEINLLIYVFVERKYNNVIEIIFIVI